MCTLSVLFLAANSFAEDDDTRERGAGALWSILQTINARNLQV